MRRKLIDMTQPSALYRLIEAGLEGTLADYVASRRPHRAWTDIADDIAADTGLVVSGETLRLWFRDRITVQVTVS